MHISFQVSNVTEIVFKDTLTPLREAANREESRINSNFVERNMESISVNPFFISIRYDFEN